MVDYHYFWKGGNIYGVNEIVNPLMRIGGDERNQVTSYGDGDRGMKEIDNLSWQWGYGGMVEIRQPLMFNGILGG